MTKGKFSIVNVAFAAAGAILLSTVCVGGAIAPAQAHQIAAPVYG
jgi:hypothetical protein